MQEKQKKSEHDPRAKSLINRNMGTYSEQSNDMRMEVSVSDARLLPDFFHVRSHVIYYSNWNTFENKVGFHDNVLVGTKGIR